MNTHRDAEGNTYTVTGYSRIRFGRNAGKIIYRLTSGGRKFIAVVVGSLKRSTEIYRIRVAGEPKRPRGWWQQQVLDAYYSAREQWLAAREQFSNGFDAEMTEFAERHPRPLFKNFLIAARIH